MPARECRPDDQECSIPKYPRTPVALRKGYTILVYFPAFRGLGRGMTSRPPINVDMISVLFADGLPRYTLYLVLRMISCVMKYVCMNLYSRGLFSVARLSCCVRYTVGHWW
jgi:hypothetical protein